MMAPDTLDRNGLSFPSLEGLAGFASPPTPRMYLMKMLAVIASAILTGHACAAGRSTLGEMPAPARSTFVYAYLQDDDPDKYSELFLEPAVIDKLPGAIVTSRINNGREVRQERHRFLLPENDAKFCHEQGSVMRHAVDGRVIGEEKWRVARPVRWDEQHLPNRLYAEDASPVDVIGTELCIAHFAKFGDDLQERTTVLMAERVLEGEEASAAKLARHEAEVEILRGCIRDREDQARNSESAERKTSELNAASDRLAVMLAGLEIQRGIIQSYKASAATRNEYNRQIQDYNAALAEHDRNVKAHDRVLERGRVDFDRIEATCSRPFDGAAMRAVCRNNPSEFCPDEKTLR